MPARHPHTPTAWAKLLAGALALACTFVPVAAGADEPPATQASDTTTTSAPPPPPPTAPPTTRPRGPQAPANSGAGRRIVYCVTCQRVWHVEADNVVARAFPVSGKRGTPRRGTYRVFSKSRMSSSGSLRLPYMVRFARGRSKAIGFHAIPIDRRGRPIQSTRQLGTYRSAGCVREAPADAAATWSFAPVGTPVVVI